VTKTLYVVLTAGPSRAILAGLFQCLLGRTNFTTSCARTERLRPRLGRQVSAACRERLACAVAALTKAGHTLADTTSSSWWCPATAA